ncbi:MAG: hypothetical protein CMH44_02835 [Muricauda sp.]|nr:hypothetical protein [Allomuricauda sp.]
MRAVSVPARCAKAKGLSGFGQGRDQVMKREWFLKYGRTLEAEQKAPPPLPVSLRQIPVLSCESAACRPSIAA